MMNILINKIIETKDLLNLKNLISELENDIYNKSKKELPNNILIELINLINNYRINNPELLLPSKQSNIKIDDFVNELLEDFSTCSEYELNMHRIVKLLNYLLDIQKFEWNSDTTNILITMIKEMKNNLRFLLINFTSKLIQSESIFIYF